MEPRTDDAVGATTLLDGRRRPRERRADVPRCAERRYYCLDAVHPQWNRARRRAGPHPRRLGRRSVCVGGDGALCRDCGVSNNRGRFLFNVISAAFLVAYSEGGDGGYLRGRLRQQRDKQRGLQPAVPVGGRPLNRRGQRHGGRGISFFDDGGIDCPYAAAFGVGFIGASTLAVAAL